MTQIIHKSIERDVAICEQSETRLLVLLVLLSIESLIINSMKFKRSKKNNSNLAVNTNFADFDV